MKSAEVYLKDCDSWCITKTRLTRYRVIASYVLSCALLLSLSAGRCEQEEGYRSDSLRLLQEALQMSQTETSSTHGEHREAVCGREGRQGIMKLYEWFVHSGGSRILQLCAEQWKWCDIGLLLGYFIPIQTWHFRSDFTVSIIQ